MQAGLTIRTSASVRYSAFVPADTVPLYFYSYFHLLYFKLAAVRVDITLMPCVHKYRAVVCHNKIL